MPHNYTDKPTLTRLISTQISNGKNEFDAPVFHYVRLPLVGEFCQFLANSIGKKVRVTYPDHDKVDVSAFNGKYYDPK